MGDVFAALAVIAMIAAGAGLVALLGQRGQRRRAAAGREAARSAKWELAEEGGHGRTLVFLRREMGEGGAVDRIVVAEIPDHEPNWSARVLEARADAANRAAMLNAQA